MVKLKKLTLRQNEAFIQLSKESQKRILGGTLFPTGTTTDFVIPNDNTYVTPVFVPPTYPYTPSR